MTKRDITPHKGGRTERVYIRVTPETKASLKRLAEVAGISVADLIELWVKAPPTAHEPIGG